MKNILLLLVVLLTASCQKVVDINPKTGDEKVIIQGYLYKDSTAKVVVTKSTAYLTSSKPAPIANAVVTLTNNQGASEVLTWNATKQWYESTMVGVLNDYYRLQVTLEGKTYKSLSILPDLEKADTITVVKKDATSFQDESYQMKLYATVSTDVKLYYLFKGYSGNTFLNGPNDIYYANNDNLAGNIDGLELGYECDPKDTTARLNMYSLTKEAYDFYNAASIQLNNDGGFFSTPPANVPSMFDNGAIGLFQCSTTQVLTTTYKAY